MNKAKKNWKNANTARFVCCLTLFWPDGQRYSAIGMVNGKISSKKKGNNGFGYDPIFIPDGYDKTFGEMESKSKMTIDHRYKAYLKIKHFFKRNAPIFLVCFVPSKNGRKLFMTSFFKGLKFTRAK